MEPVYFGLIFKEVALAVLHCVDQWDENSQSKLSAAQLRPPPYKWLHGLIQQTTWYVRETILNTFYIMTQSSEDNINLYIKLIYLEFW